MATTTTTELGRLAQGYRLCARTEGKSGKTIDIVCQSVAYLDRFLRSKGLTTDAKAIGTDEIRAFILFLQEKRCFSGHRFTQPQEKGLSGHTINCYLRSIRAFYSWLVSEAVIQVNPFDRVRIPRAPRKVIPTFSGLQLQKLLKDIDATTCSGFRDRAVILTLLDTGLRVSELCSLRLPDTRLEEGMLKVWGKGGKERVVPIGKQVQRLLWLYVNDCRPEPASPRCDLLFLTRGGRPLTKDMLEKMMVRRCRRAKVEGVRCSPHTLRHTAAVTFLRNGGDVFSLQRMLGHSSLEMTRRYCELTDIDVKKAHVVASPVDNLGLAARRPHSQAVRRKDARVSFVVQRPIISELRTK